MKHIFKKWPKISRACEPDNIKWENLGYSQKSVRCRMMIVWLIAFALVFISLIGIVLMKNKTTELKKEYKLDILCPLNTTKVEAWDDMQLKKEDRLGLITCYCKPLITTL
jgi:hypothetical protein